MHATHSCDREPKHNGVLLASCRIEFVIFQKRTVRGLGSLNVLRNDAYTWKQVERQSGRYTKPLIVIESVDFFLPVTESP